MEVVNGGDMQSAGLGTLLKKPMAEYRESHVLNAAESKAWSRETPELRRQDDPLIRTVPSSRLQQMAPGWALLGTV